MDPKLKALLESFETKTNEQKTLLDKGNDMTQEDYVKAQALDTELDGIQSSIEVFKGAAALQAKHGQRTEYLERGTTKLGSNMVPIHASGETQISTNRKGGLFVESAGEGMIEEKQWQAICKPEYQTAFVKYVTKGKEYMSGADFKTLQEGLDDSGGYLVPEDFLNNVLMRKPTPTRVAANCQSFNTTRDQLTIPKVQYTTDDLYTTGIRATWTGEVPASNTASRVTDPVFGQLRIPVFTAMLSMPVTNDLLEDSAVALQPWIEDRFGETIELLYDNMALNGTGVSQPTGILSNPGGADQPKVVVSGNANGLTGDGLINLTEDLPEQYDEASKLWFNKVNTGKAIRLLKDADGRPLVNYGTQDNGVASGRPHDVNGYPYLWSGFMPNVAANNFPIIFGDMQGYALVRRIGFSIQVLRELYAETNQILLLGRIRFGGAVVEPWRLRIQKVST